MSGLGRRMVKNILKKHHEKFLQSITDEEVRKVVAKKSFITGGSIASLLLGERIKDFDYYFMDKESAEAVARYYVATFNKLHEERTYKTTSRYSAPAVEVTEDRVKIIVPSAGITSDADIDDYDYFENRTNDAAADFVARTVTKADETDGEHADDMAEEYQPVFLSANAITLSGKVQLVIRFFGDPAEVHKNYDFVHCTCYWIPETNELVLPPNALESLLSKQLVYQGSLYPLCSVIRTRKFLQRGWYINAGQYLKMCFQISNLNLSDIRVLEEQLMGVDYAYFHQVIEYCKQRQDEDKEFQVTAPYLCTVIDRIFG